jgi:hypothetical protein
LKSSTPVLVTCLTACLALSCNSHSDGGSAPEDSGMGPDSRGAPDAAGPSDAGTDSSALDAACPYTYCEDFDEYDAGAIANGDVLGPWTATFQGAQTTMTVDPTGGFGGTKALRVTIHYLEDGGTVRATLNQHTDGGALVGSNLFGRAEIFYDTTNDAGLPLNVHSWIFNAAGKTPDGGATSMNMGGGGAKAQLNYQYPPGPKAPDGGVYLTPEGGLEYPTEQSEQGGAITTGTWHCLQWQYDGTPSNIGNVWIDGVPAITVNNPTPVTNWVLSDAYDSFDFGFTHYQELSNGVDLHLDNFALGSQMIACP